MNMHKTNSHGIAADSTDDKQNDEGIYHHLAQKKHGPA
jgi:hypothetical protein